MQESVSKMSKTNKTEVAIPVQSTAEVAVAAMDAAMFAADAGQGMEGAGQESFAIPFLGVLQKGSPTVDEALPTYNPAHRAGMFFENVTGQVFDGKAGVTIVPCSYRREFLRWGAKDAGGGFKGSYAPEVVAEMRASGEIVEVDGQLYVPLEDGTINDKKCDKFRDNRCHYVLILDEATGAWKEAVLSLSSTQIKKSKMLMSSLACVKFKNASGQMFTPPTFANLVKVTSVGESNDKGTWFGYKFEITGVVSRQEVYAAAKAFHANVSSGAVAVKHESDTAATPAQADGF